MASEIDVDELARLRAKPSFALTAYEVALIIDALEKSRGENRTDIVKLYDAGQERGKTLDRLIAERDSARALLQLVWQSDAAMPVPPITRARIAKELGQ